ncbi:MAG: prolipoprotein diacylglyceryl transferase [Parachlamydiales bacterium]|nr:prolipoprotein diacylglyceryl transferase [Parachlamydiales bacterium]
MISYIFWNPNKEIFKIPYFNIPIVWYSLCFLLGFILGYYIFISILKRYFCFFTKLDQKDILHYDILINDLILPKDGNQKELSQQILDEKININTPKRKVLSLINEFIDKKIELRFAFEKAFSKSILTIQKKACLIADRLAIYVVVATIIGARLGHVFLYEDPSFYMDNPINIIKVWEGGLASHGAAIFIIIALFVFRFHLKRYYPRITFVKLLDFVAAPTALAGFFIRMGNFFNQEILGKPTNYILAIIFGNPADSGPIVPRHPVQLYEGFFYLLVFVLLLYLSYKAYILVNEGKIIAFFLILVFTFRFFIEFLKVRQSEIITDQSFLLMGQILSIPFVILGIFFLFYSNLKSFLKAR